jgi:hypothetical protein
VQAVFLWEKGIGEPALVRRECARNYLSTKMGGLKGKRGWGPGNKFNLEGGGESILRIVSGEKINVERGDASFKDQ